ncbi:hypothetical protein HMPREF9371_0313 [Neisseria shayeganii 871]|uniref:Uncharacterized protein n=1 Tax=Neisseria shayeganii 871 TaxID=1032488 RepID=G4CFC4_9NEIS|nr:hypothetical protein HMPREF9371_0313 [Neisseria shayeganii 871]
MAMLEPKHHGFWPPQVWPKGRFFQAAAGLKNAKLYVYFFLGAIIITI